MALLKDTGIIFVPPYRNLNDSLLNLSYRESDIKLKFFLLYFDRICAGSVNFPSAGIITSSENEQILAHQNIIETISADQYTVDSLNTNFIAQLCGMYFEHMNNREGSKAWAIGFPEDVESACIAKDFGEVNCLISNLYNVLPCPNENTTFEEIISFKENNRDSLARFHHNMDKLYRGLCGTSSPEDISKIIENELLISMHDIEKLMDKASFPFFKPILSIGFSVPSGLIAAVGEKIASLYGITPGIATGVASFIALQLGFSRFSKGGNQYPTDFSYVLSGLEEKITCPNNVAELEFDVSYFSISNCVFRGGYPDRVRRPIHGQHIQHAQSSYL